MNYGRAVLIFLVMTPSSFAGVSAKRHLEMEVRLDRYFSRLAEGSHFQDPEPGACDPAPQNCIVYVAGSFPNAAQRIESAKACVGNYGDACVKWTAGTFPSYEARVVAARGCRNNRTLECATFVAGTFPSSDQRLASVAACEDAAIACVKYVAGTFPSYDERIAAAKSCSGRE